MPSLQSTLACLLSLMLFLISYESQAQRKKSPAIHLSLFPGISNDPYSEIEGSYNLSFNMTSSITKSVQGIELSGISNYNYQQFSGIQFATFTNQSGFHNISNPKERIEYTFSGFQFAALSNKTYGKGKGVQLSSFNSSEDGFEGVQFAGLLNSTDELTGMQLSGVMNVSRRGFIGFQISPLFNYSGGQSTGLQLALFNYARIAGLDYKSKSLLTENWQIGLINFSGSNNGNQIGIINISKNNEGVPLGLLNIDASHGNASLRTNDMFLSNLSISTGSPFFTNLLQFGYNYSISGLPRWGLGYGIEKEWFNPNQGGLLSTNISFWLQKNSDQKLLAGNQILRWEVIYGFKVGRLRYLEIGSGLGYRLNEASANEYGIVNMKGPFFPLVILGIQ